MKKLFTVLFLSFVLLGLVHSQESLDITSATIEDEAVYNNKQKTTQSNTSSLSETELPKQLNTLTEQKVLLQNLNSQWEELQTELSQLEKLSNDLKTTNSSLKNSLNNSMMKIADLNNICQSYMIALESNKEDTDNLISILAESESTINKYKSRISNVRIVSLITGVVSTGLLFYDKKVGITGLSVSGAVFIVTFLF